MFKSCFALCAFGSCIVGSLRLWRMIIDFDDVINALNRMSMNVSFNDYFASSSRVLHYKTEHVKTNQVQL